MDWKWVDGRRERKRREEKERKRGNADVWVMRGNDRGIMRSANDTQGERGVISEWTCLVYSHAGKV